MDGVMLETLVPWSLNGITQAPLLCTGEEEEALLTGHLITSGLVASAGKVRSVIRSGEIWEVSADLSPEAGMPMVSRLKSMAASRSPRVIRLEELTRLCDQVMSLDHSAGLHGILLSDGDKTVVGRDVGRHNALDRAVGLALQNGLRLENAVLCSSGRLSLEMFSRAAFAGIPVLATRKQVGSLCVAFAQDLDISVCRLGPVPRVYSACWRVIK